MKRLMLVAALLVAFVVLGTQPVHAASTGCQPHCAVNFSWTANFSGAAGTQGHERQDCLKLVGKTACPGVDGNVVELSWVQAEPTQGVYNWAPFDAEIARWAAHGYVSSLDVQYINDQGVSTCPTRTTASWQNMPAWVVTPTVCGNSSHGNYLYPDYCDPTFSAQLDTFIAAVAQHFSGLAYVRIGAGIGAEAAEVRDGPNSSAWKQMTAWGCTDAGFVSWVEAREAVWHSDWGSTPLVSGYNSTWYSVSREPGQMVYALADSLIGVGVSPTNLTPNFTYAGVKTTLAAINGVQIGYQTDPSVKTTNITAYMKTAYCYAHGNPVFVEWYGNVPPQTGMQQAFTAFNQQVNGLVAGPLC